MRIHTHTHTHTQDYLKQEGVYGNLVVGQYELDLLPLDFDLLSLELPFAYRDYALNGDSSSLYHAYVTFCFLWISKNDASPIWQTAMPFFLPRN